MPKCSTDSALKAVTRLCNILREPHEGFCSCFSKDSSRSCCLYLWLHVTIALCLQEQQRLPPQDSDAAQIAALDAIPSLREDIEEAQTEVNNAQEQEQLKQIEVAELQRQRNELRQQLHEAEEAHRAVISPFPRTRIFPEVINMMAGGKGLLLTGVETVTINVTIPHTQTMPNTFIN